MEINRWLVTTAAAAALCLTLNSTLAQDNPPPDGGGRQGRGQGGGRRNFDPAQMQQRMMDMIKERLEFTDDAEWQVAEPLVQKVMELRRDTTFGGMGRGMFGRRGGPGGPGGDTNNADQNPAPRRGGMFGQPSPEAEALQKAIDAKAPKAELKAALEKFQASRKAKQADLVKAQQALRKVLTSRQEAIATLSGLL
jgi:Spy/CpxP family protein refolding chaperone